MQKKHVLSIVTISAFFLSSCGGGGSSNNNTNNNPTSPSSAGPASCLATKNLILDPSQIAATKNFTPTSLRAQKNKIAYIPAENPNSKFHFSPKIVGGDSILTTTNCQSPTSAPSAQNVTNTNTVSILLTQKGSSMTALCSGTVVAKNLILTAGHCFDGVDLTSTSPGVVDFGSTYGNPANQVSISCWQRNAAYISCSSSNTANCVLNDIAWVKISGSLPNGYSPVSLLANPATISTTEEKVFGGYGTLNQNASNTAQVKRCVSTNGNSSYAGDCVLGAAAFDSQTSPQAYEKYLTVIGPITGNSPSATDTSTGNTSAKGTCSGDSGGPVYVFRNGNWVLAALTQGSNSILSPLPKVANPSCSLANFDTNNFAPCQYGYGVYTTVGNYIGWIQSTSGINVTSQ